MKTFLESAMLLTVRVVVGAIQLFVLGCAMGLVWAGAELTHKLLT